MKRSLLLLVFILFGWATDLRAQASESDSLSIYYVINRQATLYSSPDSSRQYVQLAFREPVYFQERAGRWSKVRTKHGAKGYVLSSAISNTWIRVSKRAQTIFVYQGTQLVKEIAADLGYNSFADKERRGSLRDRDHWRTPEGTFFITAKNARSQFYKAFVLNYPTAEDAERGLKQGIISQAEYAAIVRAEASASTPPMNTALGGLIEIHGRGTGARNNWTQGCVAIRDSDMDELWNWIHVGTPVLIEP